MLIPILIQSSWYQIPWIKRFLLAVLLTVCGTVGTYLLFFVENGWIGGTSFYGAVFFVPVGFLLVAKALRISYYDALDLCAPAECIMLAIMKVQCLLSGCCAGRALCVNAQGITVVFPSQIAELINALMIFAVLMILAYRGSFRARLYSLYMLIYGISRFVLNLFRETAVENPFPIGNVWSVVSIVIGIVALIILKKYGKHNSHSDDIT